MTDINEVLTMVAAQIRADAKTLIEFANEDKWGGFHIDESKREFPMGSLWREEGQILYALVRWAKPEKIVECGGWRGASATHLAQAVKMNGVGHVYSVDNGSEGGIHGELIPDDLQQYITLIKEDARVWLTAQPAQSISFLFEDASHDVGLVTEITRLALAKCEPAGLYINHDAMHDFAYDGNMNKHASPVGAWVREGLARGGAYATGYLAEPSDCGLALTVIPGIKKVAETKLASDHLAALSTPTLSTKEATEFQRISNAHIESDAFTTPQTTEEDTKETPVKKPRKPRTPKEK